MPVMIVGEWHFGTTCCPHRGLAVANQSERAKAFRIYLEDAAARPLCRRPLLHMTNIFGRFDGENYQIGFLDICYEPMVKAARLSHLYAVAQGRQQAFNDEPIYQLNKRAIYHFFANRPRPFPDFCMAANTFSQNG